MAALVYGEKTAKLNEGKSLRNKKAGECLLMKGELYFCGLLAIQSGSVDQVVCLNMETRTAYIQLKFFSEIASLS